PPASTRSCRERARSSGRCVPRTTPGRRASCSTMSFARRSTWGARCVRRRRSARVRRRSPPRPRRSQSRCSASSPARGSSSSAPAGPGDLDPAIHELDGCYRYDIDDLEAIVSETLAGRRGEAARAEAIVAAEADKFHEWQASLDVVPAIASLRARAEEIREAELLKAEGLLGRLDDGERRAVESITGQILNKLRPLPPERREQAAAAAEGVIYAEAVR